MAILSAAACRQSFTAPSIVSNNSYLVVEGVVNTGVDSTIITLSRTINLTDTIVTKPEPGAVVTVEGSDNTSFKLKDAGNGTYNAIGNSFSPAKKYRLRIKTSNSKVYLSDFVEAKNAPPIDSLSWKAMPDKLEIYASAHDPSNNTIYYRYTYNETWQFTAYYESRYKVVNGTIVPRTDDVYTCWANHRSNLVTLASSAKLSQDVIANTLVNTVSSGDEKIAIDYSILVKQYALTKDAFAFWTAMQKNTEQLGGIFDAQPSQINGNIHNINDANEIVVGYVSAGSISSARIFIKKPQLPTNYHLYDPHLCIMDSLYYRYAGAPDRNDVRDFILAGLKVPINSIRQSDVVIGYTAAQPVCADCTLRGVNKKPTFWQ